jgi:hypothetical protein
MVTQEESAPVSEGIDRLVLTCIDLRSRATSDRFEEKTEAQYKGSHGARMRVDLGMFQDDGPRPCSQNRVPEKDM